MAALLAAWSTMRPHQHRGQQNYQSLTLTDELSAAARQTAWALEGLVNNQQRRQQETQSL